MSPLRCTAWAPTSHPQTVDFTPAQTHAGLAMAIVGLTIGLALLIVGSLLSMALWVHGRGRFGPGGLAVSLRAKERLTLNSRD